MIDKHKWKLLKTRLENMGYEANTLMGNTVNCGGCAVYAHKVGKMLEAAGVPVSVILTGYFYGESVCDVRQAIIDDGRSLKNKRNWDNYGATFNHVALHIGPIHGEEFFYDSDGFEEKSVFFRHREVMPGRMTVEEIGWMARDTRGWNRSFHRKHGLPVIRRLCRETFKDLIR